MDKIEKENLEKEYAEIMDRLNGEFPNPKDMRRKEEITSLLLTDGERSDIKFNFVKGRGYKKGLNATKPYYRKGKIG